ncbi:hypothetical protein SAY87_032398 [Trapa incisa]|uniref:ATP synthase subunit 9, mitochondrial n=2 Tax=Lythraceae TaxID=3928 RepID=A0AAN7GJD1_9MYRT|nr:hypothetical protein SAY87_032398 [Trapa incisa]
MLEGAKSMGAGAATIASAGAAVGIGNVFSSLIHSVARNPSLAKQSFGYAILGFALTEAIALFAPMMAFLILFVFRSIEERRFQSHKASNYLTVESGVGYDLKRFHMKEELENGKRASERENYARTSARRLESQQAEARKPERASARV